jgi:ribonuclease BN (tRNA processing enzyme)
MEDSMPFSIQFLGVGGAFAMPTTPGDLANAPMQSNMVITAQNGKRMLFDCGTDIRFSAQMCGYGPNSFDAVYISHEHADHMGGLEWLLLNQLFGSDTKVILIAERDLSWRIWGMLRSSLMLTTKGFMRFDDYVEQRSIDMDNSWSKSSAIPGQVFWADLRLNLVKNIHVQHMMKSMFSYGMIVASNDDIIYISSDTVFDHEHIVRIAAKVTIVFHDCEVGFKTGVHAHYDELLTLPEEVRAKMWLYHYNPIEAAKKNAQGDGFCGFVQRGQTFEFN